MIPTFEQWLIREGINSKEEYERDLKSQGLSEEAIAACWYRVEDLYLFETNQ